MKKLKQIGIITVLFASFLFISCLGDKDGGDGEGPCLDNDGDGYGLLCAQGWDCDDENPDVFPGAPELCDGVDNQCLGDEGFGAIDEGGCPLYGWTRRMGAEEGDADVGYSISVDNNGNVYVTGHFDGTSDFAEDFGGSDIKTSAKIGTSDIFVTRINSDLSYGWTRRMGGLHYDWGYDISLDKNGNIFMTGGFTDTVNFAEDFGGSDIKTPVSVDDVFVTRINSDGSYGWTRRIGGSGNDWCYKMDLDNDGNIYLTGTFNRPVNFAEDFGGNDTKTPLEAENIFVTRINSDGSYGWTRRMGGNNPHVGNKGNAIFVDNNGNIYVTGHFSGTADFAEDFGGSDIKISQGYNDVFITRIYSDGTYGWTKRIGGKNHDSGIDLSLDRKGNMFVTGFFDDTVNFAEDFGGRDLKKNTGGDDIFVTRINSDLSYGWTRRIGGESHNGIKRIYADSNGNLYLTGFFGEKINFAEDFGGKDLKSPKKIYMWDIFITQIHSDGSYGWTRRIGGNEWDESEGIYLDNNGDVYLTGSFRDIVNFAEDFGGSDIKTSAGNYDIFVTKINITQ